MWATVRKSFGPEIIMKEILKEKTDISERDNKPFYPMTKLQA